MRRGRRRRDRRRRRRDRRLQPRRPPGRRLRADGGRAARGRRGRRSARAGARRRRDPRRRRRRCARSRSAPTRCSSAGPYAWGLATGGEAGVRGVIDAFAEDLRRALALAGCPTLADVDARPRAACRLVTDFFSQRACNGADARGRSLHAGNLLREEPLFRSPFADCPNRKTVKERKTLLAGPLSGVPEPGLILLVAQLRSRGHSGHMAKSRSTKQGGVRGLLLSLQSAVRAGARRALRDVSPQRPRGPAPAAAAALQLPPGAAHAVGVGVSLRAGAGGAARILTAPRIGSCRHTRRRGARHRVRSRGDHGAGQVAGLAGRRTARAAATSCEASRRRLLVDCGSGVFAQLRRVRRLRRRRRDRAVAHARRPLPRPDPVRLRADLRAAPAAGAGRRLAGHRQPGAPAAARAARRGRGAARDRRGRRPAGAVSTRPSS